MKTPRDGSQNIIGCTVVGGSVTQAGPAGTSQHIGNVTVTGGDLIQDAYGAHRGDCGVCGAPGVPVVPSCGPDLMRVLQCADVEACGR